MLKKYREKKSLQPVSKCWSRFLESYLDFKKIPTYAQPTHFGTKNHLEIISKT